MKKWSIVNDGPDAERFIGKLDNGQYYVDDDFFWKWALREKCGNTEFFLVRIFL